MNTMRFPLLSFLVLSLLVPTLAMASKVEDYSQTINIFREAPETKPFFDTAYGYAVFPKIGKGAFVVGGAYGSGQVYHEDKVTGFTRLVKASFGLQVGGESFSQIIFFQDKRAYDEFTTGEFGLNANATVVVIRGGGHAQTGSSGTTAGESGVGTMGPQTTKYKKGMAVFVRIRGGAMFDVSVAGQKFSFKPYVEPPRSQTLQ